MLFSEIELVFISLDWLRISWLVENVFWDNTHSLVQRKGRLCKNQRVCVGVIG